MPGEYEVVVVLYIVGTSYDAALLQHLASKLPILYYQFYKELILLIPTNTTIDFKIFIIYYGDLPYYNILYYLPL